MSLWMWCCRSRFVGDRITFVGMRIVFMGTPDFSVPVLERLIAGGHEVCAVYTQPDKPGGRGRKVSFSPVKRASLGHGITVHQPSSLGSPAEVERLRSLSPEVIVVASFGQILPQRVLEIPPLGCLNIHPSLLPRHRGPSPIAGAILAGDEESGVTIMLMGRGLDTGPIIAQERMPISPQDTTGLLSAKLAQLGAGLLEETLPRWSSHELVPNPQDEGSATYTRLISKEDGLIDWQMSAQELERRVRAFQPWPGCYTWWQGGHLKIEQAVPLPGGDGEPGGVVELHLDGIAFGVQTGDGILGVRQLQLEGKRAMGSEEFLRGQRGFIGAILP